MRACRRSLQDSKAGASAKSRAIPMPNRPGGASGTFVSSTNALRWSLKRGSSGSPTGIEHQIKDIEHKSTTRLISTLHANGVQTVVIGDVRDIRQDNDVGHTNNQKIHQWSHGSVRHKLTYKAERLCMYVALQDEHYTSRTCPHCLYVRSKVKGRVFRCPKCGWTYHRDGVGAINIRQKYLGHGPVVGAMAPPISIRVVAGVARTEKVYVRENVCMGHCAEAVGLRDHAECHTITLPNSVSIMSDRAWFCHPSLSWCE